MNNSPDANENLETKEDTFSNGRMLLIYIRNNLTILGVQAFFITLALNLSVVTRFNIPPFTYAEVLLYCFILLVLTHSIKLFIVIDYFTVITASLEQLRKQVTNISSLNYNIGVTHLARLMEIDEKVAKHLTIKETEMKLSDVKPLDKKTLTVKEIAERHKCSVRSIEAQLKKGILVELEHTSDKNVAKEIALDHLGEVPNYYDKLEKVEKK